MGEVKQNLIKDILQAKFLNDILSKISNRVHKKVGGF